MRDSTARHDFEPVHSAVPDVDTVSVRRLGNDYCIRTVRAHPSLLREPRHARESTAFLIDGPTDFYGSIHRDPGAPNRFRRVDRSSDPGLHVARSSSIDAPIAHNSAEWIDGPTIANRHNIEMAIQMHQRTHAPPLL